MRIFRSTSKYLYVIDGGNILRFMDNRSTYGTGSERLLTCKENEQLLRLFQLSPVRILDLSYISGNDAEKDQTKDNIEKLAGFKCKLPAEP
jgi:hypothetical protein